MLALIILFLKASTAFAICPTSPEAFPSTCLSVIPLPNALRTSIALYKGLKFLYNNKVIMPAVISKNSIITDIIETEYKNSYFLILLMSFISHINIQLSMYSFTDI